MTQPAAMMVRLRPHGASSCGPLSSSTAAPPPPSRTALCTVCHRHLQRSSRSTSPAARLLSSVSCPAKSPVTTLVTSSTMALCERPLSRMNGTGGQRRMASLSSVSAQRRLSLASLRTQQQQHQWQKQERRRGAPPPPRAAGSEVSSDTYWVTVANAIAVVVGIGGTGVVTGLLLRYKLWQDAKREIEKMKAEGMNPEEIFAKAEAAAAAAEEQQKMMMGSSLAAAVEESAADEDTAPAAVAAATATAGDAPVETVAQAGATGTTAAEGVAASTGSGSGRRNRPVVRE